MRDTLERYLLERIGADEGSAGAAVVLESIDRYMAGEYDGLSHRAYLAQAESDGTMPMYAKAFVLHNLAAKLAALLSETWGDNPADAPIMRQRARYAQLHTQHRGEEEVLSAEMTILAKAIDAAAAAERASTPAPCINTN